ncbi:MAG: mechanosensitive ion channel family protein [Nitrososphaerales archaeon]
MAFFPLTGAQLGQYLLIVAFKLALFLIILAIGWVIGKTIGALVGKLASRAGADALLRQTVIGRTLMRADRPSSRLTKDLARWLIYIAAFLIALESLALPIITVYVIAFLAYLPILIGSIIILIVGLILSDWVGEFVKKSFSPEKRDLFYLDFVGNIVKVILYFVTITLTLTHLGVNVTILYIFAQALAWALAIFVGTAAGIVVGWMLKDKVKEWISS